jgi:hypothetical protein
VPGIQIITITGKQQAAYQQLVSRYTSKKGLKDLIAQDFNLYKKSMYGFTLGYQKNDQLCAALTFSISGNELANQSVGEISQMYIPQSVQIATAGRRLLNAMLTIIKEDFPDIRWIMLKTPINEPGFKRLYSGFGFVEYEPLDSNGVNFSGFVNMQISLTDI